MKAVILAGGSGTRLWPASTKEKPKQFLDINGKGSLLVQTMQRCSHFGIKDEIYIVTRNSYAFQVNSLLQEFNLAFSEQQIILEPCPRNTASAILLAAKYLLEFSKASLEDVILVLPSDHLIEITDQLITACKLSKKLAQEGYIVTFGINPYRPEIGYGYIKSKPAEPTSFDQNESLACGLPVTSFKEKPPLETAMQYLSEGGYYWNTGMFACTIESIFAEIRMHVPTLAPYLEMDYSSFVARFNELPDISFDYAVMEKTKQAVVVPLDVQWSDVGSWESIYELLPMDQNRNCTQGSVISTETTDSLLINRTKHPMAVTGMQNVIAIQTDEGLLITQRGGGNHNLRLIANDLCPI